MDVAREAPSLHLLSTVEVPFAPRTPPHAQRTWHGTDSEGRYKKRPHPTLGPEHVDYRFNSHGYRCAEFDVARTDESLVVVSLGASEVLGTGVPVDRTSTALFADALAARLGRQPIAWSLGIGGGSADYVSRMLFSVLAVLKPHVVLITFPHSARREHLDDDGNVHCHNGAVRRRKLSERLLDPETYVLTEAHLNLASECNDKINLYKNYKTCAALCAEHDVMWLFSATHDAFLDSIEALVDHDHWVRPGIADLKVGEDAVALGRDMAHPGLGPHRETAENSLRQLEVAHGRQLKALALKEMTTSP